MKRDKDLFRNILLNLEAYDEFNRGTINELDEFVDKFSDVDIEILSSHIRLLQDARCLENFAFGSGGYISLGRMTNSGYDFLDTVRDPEIWKQTKVVSEKVSGWSVDLLADIAKGLIKTKIKKHIGVEI